MIRKVKREPSPDVHGKYQAKAPVKKERLDGPAILEKLKAELVLPAVAAAPAAAADADAAPLAKTMLASTLKRAFRPDHGLWLHKLERGYAIHTLMKRMGYTWADVSELIASDAQDKSSNSSSKVPLLIFRDLILGAKMYRLRYLQPRDGTLTAINTHLKVIVAAMAEASLEEQAWWSADPPDYIEVQHNGKTFHMVDPDWVYAASR